VCEEDSTSSCASSMSAEVTVDVSSCTLQSLCLKYLFYEGHAIHGPRRIVQDTFQLWISVE
jgi:hypothetical protein